MKKIVLSLIILAVLGLIGWRAAQQIMSMGHSGPRHNGPMPTAVEIEPVTKHTIRDVGHFTGSLYPNSKFVVAPKISGRLEKLRVNIGDNVRAGDLIAELENNEYRQQVDQAGAELDVARANLQESRIAQSTASRELDRVKRLRKSKIASESELEAAQAQYQAQEAKNKVALAQVDQKKAMLKAAQVRLAYTRITLPDRNDGEKWVVGERFVDQGAMLAANSPIVSILDIRKLIAVIYVIDRDYPKIKLGQPADVTADVYPGRTFSGRVVRMAPELKESSREARVEVEIPNQDLALKPGMFVRVQIEYAVRSDVTTVPIDALIKRNNREGIFLADIEKKTARFVPLTLGVVNDELAEVIKPPLEGYVITMGQHLLEDGAPILLSSTDARQEAAAGEPGTSGQRPITR